MGGVFFGALGTGIGALIGTKKETIYIFGEMERYKTQLQKIKSYALFHN